MIVLLDLLVFAIIAGAALFFVTQIALPVKNGTPLFPFLGKSETGHKMEEAAEELEEVAEMEQLREMQDEINRRKAQLKKDKE